MNGLNGSPELGNGYFSIANELWDALSSAKLRSRERQLVGIILRLTYGCRPEDAQGRYCFIPTWSALAKAAGLYGSDIKSVVLSLEEKRIIFVDWKHKGVAINKYYMTWRVQWLGADQQKNLRELVAHNLSLDDADKVLADLLTVRIEEGKSDNVSKTLTTLVKHQEGKQNTNNVSKTLTTLAKHQQGKQITTNDVSNLLTSTDPKRRSRKASGPPKESIKEKKRTKRTRDPGKLPRARAQASGKSGKKEDSFQLSLEEKKKTHRTGEGINAILECYLPYSDHDCLLFNLLLEHSEDEILDLVEKAKKEDRHDPLDWIDKGCPVEW